MIAYNIDCQDIPEVYFFTATPLAKLDYYIERCLKHNFYYYEGECLTNCKIKNNSEVMNRFDFLIFFIDSLLQFIKNYSKQKEIKDELLQFTLLFVEKPIVKSVRTDGVSTFFRFMNGDYVVKEIGKCEDLTGKKKEIQEMIDKIWDFFKEEHFNSII